MKAGHYSGIKGVSMEDLAVVETMGSIVDRSKETLAASDIAIAEFRRLMLKAAREVEAGASALGLGSAIPRSDIRAFEGVVAKSTDWRSLALSPKEDALFRTAAE